MRKYFFLIFALLIFYPEVSNSQWYQQYIDANISIQDIKFANRNTGWLCGANLIYKTTNSGTNWILQPNPAQSIIFAIHPVNDSVVYAAGWCTILKTTNGGENWTGLRAGTPEIGCTGQYFNGLFFKDENTGWFCGSQSAIRTTDGGNTFIDSMGISGSMFDINFKDDSTGVVSSSNYNFFRTTNSGTNWNFVPLPHSTTSECYHLSFVNDTGWTASLVENNVYKTINYGITWDSICQIQGGHNYYTYSIEFSSSSTGYSGGTLGKIHKTTDGGFTWLLEDTERFGNARYNSIYAYNDSIVWAAGAISKILYTTTGGGLLVSGNEPNENIPADFKLYQNYPNPFNPSTKIKYEIKHESNIKIIISDLSGKVLKNLINKKHQAGSYEIIFDAINLSSGMYLYQMIIDEKILYSKKMIFLK